jgi:hypothetical protein
MLKHILTGQLKPVNINFEADKPVTGGGAMDSLLKDLEGDDDVDELDPTAEDKVEETKVEPKKETLVEQAPIDYDTLAAKFGSVVADQLKPKDEPKALTEAERNKLLEIMDLDDEWFAEFNTPEKQRVALNKMREADRRHMNVMLKAAVHHLETKFGAQLQPIQERTQAADAQSAYSDFIGKYPVLAEPKYQELLKLGSKELAGRNFKTKDEGFAALATLVEKTVKSIDPTFSLSGGPAGNNKPKQNNDSSRTLPVAKSGAGGSGGGSGGEGSKARSPMDALLGSKT